MQNPQPSAWHTGSHECMFLSFLPSFPLCLHSSFSSAFSTAPSLHSFFSFPILPSLLASSSSLSEEKSVSYYDAVSQFICFIQLQITRQQGPCGGHLLTGLSEPAQGRCSINAWGISDPLEGVRGKPASLVSWLSHPSFF